MQHATGISRRRLLKTAALATGASVAAPYMRTSYAAGRLTLGFWEHWVPSTNAVMKKICDEWGARNHVDVQIDFISGTGNKLTVTGEAEAQARTGHDIFWQNTWEVASRRRHLEPVDDVMAALIKDYGPPNPVAEFVAKLDGRWYAVPAQASIVFPCCSRLDLYQQHCGIDLRQMFPPNDNRDPALVGTWTWDTYLSTAEKLYKAGYPVGLPMGQTDDSIQWVAALFRSFGAVMIDEQDRIRVNSDETRAALEYLKKLMPLNPPDVYAWDDAGNNRWLISGRGSNIINPPSAWAVAKRDAMKVAEQCWTHDVPRGPKGRYTSYWSRNYGIWNFSKNKQAAKDLLLYISQKDQARRLEAGSQGYDIPPFASFLDFPTWAEEGPPSGTIYNYPPRGDEETTIPGYPARPEVAVHIYNQALQPIMVAKVTAGGETIDNAIKWAAGELEGYLQAARR